MEDIRVRFAPSPTGFLHIGNARTALFNWLFARHNNGKFILRIEDTDTERSSERSMVSIMDDLRWLGLEWDEGPDLGGEYGPYRQSLRTSVYEEYSNVLKERGLIYPCFCTQEELSERRLEQEKRGEPPRYDNRCRHLTEREINDYQKQGRKFSWRFKVPAKIVVVKDMIRGDVSFDTSLMGDFVILKQDGMPTFHFAVSVDDMCMKITHVIRGEDHLSNTPRHILLWEAFGKKPPLFAHNTLTLGPDGERLSKRHGAVSVVEYKRLGYLPEALLNYLALLGWSSGDKKELYSLKELIDAFNLEGLSASQALFNKEKLDWVNSWHIRNADIARLTEICLPYLKKEKLIRGAVSDEMFKNLERMIEAIRPNLITLADSVGYMKIFLSNTIEITDIKGKEILGVEYVPLLFKILKDLFAKADKISLEGTKKIFSEAQHITGVKGKNFYMPLRIALTGMSEGPELVDVIPLLDKEKILKRLTLQ
jgi:glutamyl-tRNA synthetase